MIKAAVAVVLLAAPAAADVTLRSPPSIVGATLVDPTRRYDHGVLGDAIEWGGIELQVDPCPAGCFDGGPVYSVTITLPQTRVFEDVAVRWADLDGDNAAEALVVETDIALGASLAVYDLAGIKRAATPFIGQPNRWLAPAGIGDFDGDGRVEIAYVDRPHLVGDLVFVRLVKDQLVEIARAPGFSNHRIGSPTIAGGVRACPGGDQLILASFDWTRAIAISLQGGAVQMTELGPISQPTDLQRHMDCPD